MKNPSDRETGDRLYPQLKTTYKNGALILTGMILNVLVGFLIKLLIVRNTTQEEFGIYSLAIALSGIISTLSFAGLQEGAPRYISVFIGEGSIEDAKAISKASTNIGIVTGVTAFCLLFFFSDAISNRILHIPQLAFPLKIISFSVPFFVLSYIVIGVLRGYDLMKPKAFYQDMGAPFIFFLFLCIVFLLKLPFISIICAYVISILFLFVILICSAHRELGFNAWSLKGGRWYGRIMALSVPIFISTIMMMVLDFTDTLMLAKYAGIQAVAVYNVSASLARFITFPLAALGFVLIPLAGKLYARKEIPELKRLYQVLTRWTLLAAAPLFLVLFFLPETVVTNLFGHRFLESALPLRILAAGFLLQTFSGASGQLMVVGNMKKAIATISVFGIALNIVLNYILIGKMHNGPEGAALATAISYFIISATCSLVVYKETGIHPINLGHVTGQAPESGNLSQDF